MWMREHLVEKPWGADGRILDKKLSRSQEPIVNLISSQAIPSPED
jgi:hypothetical protein